MGSIIKYLFRYKHKNGVEDLYKAKRFLEELITEHHKVDTTIRKEEPV